MTGDEYEAMHKAHERYKTRHTLAACAGALSWVWVACELLKLTYGA